MANGNDDEVGEEIDLDEDQRPPVAVPPSVIPPVAPAPSDAPVPAARWSSIGTATDQLRAGQPVTALPSQPAWSGKDWAAWQQRQAVVPQAAQAAQVQAQAMREQVELEQTLQANQAANKSLKAIQASVQFLGLRRYQNDLAAGIPVEKAIARNAPLMFWTHPQSIAPALRAAQPAPVPSVMTDPASGERAWVSGGRVTRIPVPLPAFTTPSTTAQPVTTPEGKVLGYSAITGPRSARIISAQREGSLSDVEKAQLRNLEKRQAAIQKEMDSSNFQLQEPLPEYKPAHDKMRSELAQITEHMNSLLGKGTPAAPATAPAAAATPAPAPAKVAVIGPKGQRGFVPTNTKLPSGWRLAP